jgi:carboxyl-terminal processing protease
MKKLLLFIVLFTASFIVSAQQPAASSLATRARTLKIFLDKNHYAPLRWTDTASLRLWHRWMETLDDDKMYFLQAEVSELEKYKTSLDEEINGNGWAFFDQSIRIFKRALQRSDSVQKAILSAPSDFSKPAILHFPFKTYPATVGELTERHQHITRWRILRNIASAVDTADLLPSNFNVAPADFAAREKKVKIQLQKQHDILLKEMMAYDAVFENNYGDAYLHCISWCYDPHTSYMNLADKKDFETGLSGFEYSTGLALDKDEDGNYTIARLEPGGSAWRSGELHTGDFITAIKKGSEPERDLSLMDEDEVDEMLSGTSDEKVELTVRTTAGTAKKVLLTKEKITDDEGIVKSYLINGAKKIGYIQLPGFYSREEDDGEEGKIDGCANDVSKEIIKLTRDGIDGLILDLRQNGGGSIWEAMQLAGIFIDYGPVGSIKDKTGKIRFLKDPNRGTVYDGPLLVMINGGSASASELTGAVLQDYKRALIVGSTSYGKGTAQTIQPMDTSFSQETTSKKDYSSFTDYVKVTGGKFYRVDGTTTQWKGVEPDITIPDLYAASQKRERNIPSALLPDNAKQAIYQPLKGLPVEKLAAESRKRIETDSIFIQVKKVAGWLQQMNEGRDIPLQWPAYTGMYKKSKEMMTLVEMIEEQKNKLLTVTNNNFDSEKIKFAAESGKELNKMYLHQVASDPYISESFRILQDWLSIP